MLVLITHLIPSCSNLPSSQNPSSCIQEKIEVKTSERPSIPFTPEKAFFPLRVNPQGKITPSYRWRECVKRIGICIKWQDRILYFDSLDWFYAGEYGLMKRPLP